MLGLVVEKDRGAVDLHRFAKIAQRMGEAAGWVKNVLAIARNAPGADRWPTDEDMAAEILRRIEERRKR